MAAVTALRKTAGPPTEEGAAPKKDRITGTREHLKKLLADLEAIGKTKQTPQDFKRICELVAFAKSNLTRLSYTYPQQL